MDKYFKVAEDLEDGSSFFKPPGDLDKNFEAMTSTSNNVMQYIESIQSGTKSEGPTSGGGVKFVTFDELKSMVYSGYNIIKATYYKHFNMIEVTFDIPSRARSR